MAETPEHQTDKNEHDADEPDETAGKDESSKDRAEEREQELLDEGLEETFPASDPVSSKHIT